MAGDVPARLDAPAESSQPKPEPKKKRAWAPKVKSGTEPFPSWRRLGWSRQASRLTRRETRYLGCRQCKASHVKCDEQRPVCGRCHRRQIACNQPLSWRSHRGSAASAFQPLLPDPSKPRALRLVEPSACLMTPSEVPYFDNFRHNVIYQLGHGFSGFWRNTVLRESGRDDCVRNAIIALGALACAQKQYGSDWTTVDAQAGLPLYKTQLQTLAGAPGYDHYYQALVHYTRALGSLRRLITMPLQSSGAGRAILIATILLVGFETLQGNPAAADQLGALGLSLLHEPIMQGSLATKGPSSASQIASILDDESTCEAETVLVRHMLLNAGLSSRYRQAREAILRLPSPAAYGPRPWPFPPDARYSASEFSRMWTQCLLHAIMWCIRVQAAMLVHQSSGEDHHSSAAEQWHVYQQEQTLMMALLKAWMAANQQRMVQAMAASEHGQVSYYSEAGLAMAGCYYCIYTVFDLSDKPGGDDYKSAMGELLAGIEAALQGRPNNTTTLRPYGAVLEGINPVMAQFTLQMPHPGLRHRAMEVWGKVLTFNPAAG
ncbi:uncharacterized protein B0I36DRAFT_332515 [Microdochium trichocladiopsis]|uniref:Zn(2)-C6 fungal-type domain-containing protein n=1 Tax=Microdochium trichocladiopsis TaxID=1682393 RepID=A0A9P8Y0Q6_9PEZI|nr:uncharacterized protein B0I36DRAFT_332515 [Microdochium trichocladiopsis]KAH7025093.1 hypothetical protein B0I36DRAFT_332515 [Microdochium trichocladiopsis]